MAQPIPKKILDTHVIEEKPFYTVLFDMHSVMKTSMIDNRTNTKGETYGMAFQTILQIKKILMKKNFDFVYAFYDGANSGQLRFNYLADYKSNREGKNFDVSTCQSQYYKEMDKFMQRVYKNKQKQINPEKQKQKETDKEIFFSCKPKIQEYLEDLYVRQVEADLCEGDDLIAWYVQHKQSNERIVIVSSDMDLSQLISDKNYVTMFNLRLKKFITEANFYENFAYHHSNVVLQKVLLGDTSDMIFGVKQLGDKTLYEICPEFKERKVMLYEVLNKVKELQQKRIEDKKKPKKVYENILNQVTDGCHGEGKLFEINAKIIDLKTPLLTDEAIEMLNEISYSPIDPDGRSLANLYKLMVRDGIDELLNENKFATFFSTFSGLRDKEIKFYKKWLSENN